MPYLHQILLIFMIPVRSVLRPSMYYGLRFSRSFMHFFIHTFFIHTFFSFIHFLIPILLAKKFVSNWCEQLRFASYLQKIAKSHDRVVWQHRLKDRQHWFCVSSRIRNGNLRWEFFVQRRSTFCPFCDKMKLALTLLLFCLATRSYSVAGRKVHLVNVVGQDE